MRDVRTYTFGNAGLMSKRNKYYACDGGAGAGAGTAAATAGGGGCDNWLSMIFHAIILSHYNEKVLH